MPSATVDKKGTELSFTDSGAPDSNDYTTLVIFHGAGFTGNTFYKLIPLASADNTRLIIVDRREYKGSTKYTDADIDDLHAGRSIFMERIGQEIANFLLWIVDTQNTPRSGPGRRSGGLVVLGWSLGNATTLAFLGQTDAIPRASYGKLEPYLRHFILYDPGDLSFDYQDTFDIQPYDPDTFGTVVSSWYVHANLPNPKSTIRRSDKPPSIDNMTSDELDIEAAKRTEFAMFLPAIRPVLKEQRRKALFDENISAEIFPGLRVDVISPKMTVLGCVWARMMIEKDYTKAIQAGKQTRPIRVVPLEQYNHFMHWEDPEVFWRVIADSIFH